MRSSLLVVPFAGPACWGRITSAGFNREQRLHADDAGSCGFGTPTDNANVLPVTGFLGDHGGATATIDLPDGSLAIDRIPPAECTDRDGLPVRVDPRGFTRPVGRGCDQGAFEFSEAPRAAWLQGCCELPDATLRAALATIAEAAAELGKAISSQDPQLAQALAGASAALEAGVLAVEVAGTPQDGAARAGTLDALVEALAVVVAEIAKDPQAPGPLVTELEATLQGLGPIVAAVDQAIGVALAADGMPEQETVELAAALAFASLPPGLAQSLRVKLEAALGAVEREQPDVAARELGAFAHEVQARKGKGLDPARADAFAAAATRIAGLLQRQP